MGLTGSAAAEARLGGVDRGHLRRQLLELKRQARELDERIRRIEAELARDAPARAVVTTSMASTPASNCMLPYYRDGRGIKHMRLECLEPTDELSCDPPYTLDERGLRRFRPECLSAAEVPSRTDR